MYVPLFFLVRFIKLNDYLFLRIVSINLWVNVLTSIIDRPTDSFTSGTNWVFGTPRTTNYLVNNNYYPFQSLGSPLDPNLLTWSPSSSQTTPSVTYNPSPNTITAGEKRD